MKIPYGVADFYSLRTEGPLHAHRRGRGRLRLRAYAVVALGFERLVVRLLP